MEKREGDRFKAGNKYKGKLILADAVTIRDISISGVCLETSERLTTNNLYRIEMVDKDKERMTLTGVAVRSFLRGTLREKDNTVPLYEVGLKFIELKNNEKVFLEKLIKELTKE